MLIRQYSALEKGLIEWQIMRIIFIPLRMATEIIIIFSKGAGTQALYSHTPRYNCSHVFGMCR